MSAATSAGKTRVLRVALGARAYPVYIGAGNLAGLGAEVAARLRPRTALLVTQPPAGRRYGARVMRSLRGAGIKTLRFEVPDGERSKNMRRVESLLQQMLSAGAERGGSVVVALGGGVVGDLAGFAAATLFRGVPVVQVPTTLLAMADSSVGGKTGVNLPQGKNLAGAFHQPALVWMDARTLHSLPPRQLRAGMAEIIKHAAICDARLFALLEREMPALLSLENEAALLRVLARNIRIKADVVRRDERESGPRMLLNFGHTLGHAVEALARYRGVLHGEAVAIGMAYAARLSEHLGAAEAGTARRLTALLRRAGLPCAAPRHARADYLRAIAADKKKRAGRINFVALRRIGEARLLPLAPREILPARFFENSLSCAR